MMRTLLMIGAGPAQAAGIATAQRLGCRVVAIDGNPEAEGFALADQSAVVDILDTQAVIGMARELKPDGCMSVASEVCLPAVAAVNEALGLPGLSLEQTVLATNKGLIRKRLAEYGVPGPPFAEIDSGDRLDAALSAAGLPAVIKPVDNAGSRGVTYVADRQEARAAYEHARKYSRCGRVIIEGFMPGREVSAEAFVAGGEITVLALSDKDRTAPPNLLDTRVVFPASWPDITERAIRKTAVDAIRATGLDDCPIHMELIVTPDGPKVVELAARGPGFKVYTEMIPHVTGVDPVAAQVRLLMGQKVDLQPRGKLRGACLQFFGSDKSGTVVEIVSPTIPLTAGEAECKIYVAKGDPVKALTCGDHRLGHVITLADTREEAVNRAQSIVENAQILIEGR